MDSAYQPQMKVYKGNGGPVPAKYCAAPAPVAPFQFQVKDSQTGTALSGAAFVLYHEDKIVDFAQSDVCGTVSFETPPPGCYRLEETSPPPGYETSGHSYSVVVDYGSRVSVDGIPIERFSVGNLLYRIAPMEGFSED